nr:unnamed protein product [Digitaria exilis]
MKSAVTLLLTILERVAPESHCLRVKVYRYWDSRNYPHVPMG